MESQKQESIDHYISILKSGKSISQFCPYLKEVVSQLGGIKNFKVLISDLNFYSLKEVSK